MRTKAQGEIFGIALLFVVIILGIVLFSKMGLLEGEQDPIQDKTYQILAQSSLDMMLKTSTGCEIERGQDEILDLIMFCIGHSYRPTLTCEDGRVINICDESKFLLNESLSIYFHNVTNHSFGPILYYLDIWSPDALSHQEYESLNFTNAYLGTGIPSTSGDYYSYRNTFPVPGERLSAPTGFSKVSSGVFSYQSANRELNFELLLYYRK